MCIGVAAGILLVLLILFTLVLTKRESGIGGGGGCGNAGQLTNTITTTRCQASSAADVMSSPSKASYGHGAAEDGGGEKDFLGLQHGHDVSLAMPEKMEMGSWCNSFRRKQENTIMGCVLKPSQAQKNTTQQKTKTTDQEEEEVSMG